MRVISQCNAGYFTRCSWMHQEHARNDSSGESNPWVGICVIDGRLPRVFRGLAPSAPPAPLSLPLCFWVGMWKRESSQSPHVSASHRSEYSPSPRLNTPMRRKWLVDALLLDIRSQIDDIYSLFFPLRKSLPRDSPAQLESADGNNLWVLTERTLFRSSAGM